MLKFKLICYLNCDGNSFVMLSCFNVVNMVYYVLMIKGFLLNEEEYFNSLDVCIYFVENVIVSYLV